MHIIKNLKNQIKSNPKNFLIYSILRILVIIVMIRSIFTRNFEAVFLCALSLILLLGPAFVEKNFQIEIPDGLEIGIYLFIFASEILGEIINFYEMIPWWDTMLHTINGFACAAIGFALVDLMNERKDGIKKLSPIYLSFVAFCFSMTIGVLWEFGEYTVDHLFLTDSQRDTLVKEFSSYTMDPSHEKPLKISDIEYTEIHAKSGEVYIVENGYLDIGINDTIKDLFVNLIGAILFSINGYVFVKKRTNKQLIEQIVPRPMHSSEQDEI